MSGHILGHRYFPLDEVLARPRMKILRALHHFDWVTADELFVACNADEFARGNWTSALSHEVRRGAVEVNTVEMANHGSSGNRTLRVRYYRITPRGRAAVEQLRANYQRAMEAA